MRVLYFTRDYTTHDHRFLSSLARAGYETYLLRLERSLFAKEKRQLPEGVTEVSWAGGKKPFRWLNLPAYRNDLQRVIGQIKPDLIHAGPVPNCAFLASLCNFHPLVSMSWGSDLLLDSYGSRISRWLSRKALQKTDVFLGDCQAVARRAKELGYRGEKTVLFPWGIDLEQFTPQAESQLRLELGWEDNFVLLSLRSWEPLYGVDTIARAFVRSARTNPALRLLMLGNGSLSGKLREIFSLGGVLDKVHFTGQVAQQNLPRYYHAADLYLSASLSDGSSVSLMEALACALPALVSDIPGNREWIEEGKEGWFFPTGDDLHLAQKIDFAFEQRNRLQNFKISARQLAEKRADWKKNFSELERAYRLAVTGL